VAVHTTGEIKMLRQYDSDLAGRFTWGGILTLVTVTSTLAAACGTPFAALGALGALFLPRRDAFILIFVNWLANQAIGFAFLHYPHTLECYLGGLHLLVAAWLCMIAAMFTKFPLGRRGAALRAMVSFAAALVVYEGTLFALSPSASASDFALPVVAYIVKVNAIAFVGLLLVKTAASRLGFAFPPSQLASAADGR
jgi:hypothetical protein